MSIAIIGKNKNDTMRVRNTLICYARKSGLFSEFVPYETVTDLAFGLVKHSHSSVVIHKDALESYELALRLRDAAANCKIVLLTSDGNLAADGYEIPVDYCCEPALQDSSLKNLFEKIIF